MVAANPVCGQSCVNNAWLTELKACNNVLVCLCSNSNYISSFYSCIDAACSQADISTWTLNAQQDCALFGATWDPSSGQISTAISNSVQTSVVVVPQTTLISQVALSSVVSEFGFTYFPSTTTKILLSSTNAAKTQYISSTQTETPDSLSEKDGLPTGAIVGIAVGAVAVILLAILLGFLIWRRKVNKAKAAASETVATTKDNAATGQVFEKDSKTVSTATITEIKPFLKPPEVETAAGLEHIYKGSEPSNENPHLPLSPSPTYVEVAGTIPSEIDASHQHTASRSLPHQGLAEADFMPPSHNITSLPSELEDHSYTVYHQQSTPPKIPTFPPASSLHLSSASTVEPTWSVSSALPTPPYMIPNTRSREGDGEDLELNRMKAEIEALKKEKELVQHLQDIETRERELKRKIAERESQRE